MKKLYFIAVVIFSIFTTATAQQTTYTTTFYSTNAWSNDLTTANVAWKSTKGCKVKNGVTLCPTGGETELSKRDGQFAHCEFADAATKFLIAKNFQIDLSTTLPTGITKDDIEIKAIELRVEKYSNTPNIIKDNQVRLIKNGAINVTGYNINESDKAKTQDWKDTSTVHTYGGINDKYPLWGTTWTPADLESPEFGVAFSAVAPDPSLNLFAYVGMIRIRVVYAQKAPVSPLPVTLVRFSAKPEAKQVVLNWATASEKNNDYFGIEKSADGREFKTIATIKGAGNSIELKEYQYVDATYSPKTVYYRLKQTDFDGTFAYSNIVAVNTKGEFEPTISVYPNPSDGKNLKIAANFLHQAPTELLIYNQTGALIYKSEIAPTTQQDVSLQPISSLAPGIYFTVLSQKDIQVKEKIVIQ